MANTLHLTAAPVDLAALIIFIVAYLVVIFTHLRKSKPVILAAGVR